MSRINFNRRALQAQRRRNWIRAARLRAAERKQQANPSRITE